MALVQKVGLFKTSLGKGENAGAQRDSRTCRGQCSSRSDCRQRAT